MAHDAGMVRNSRFWLQDGVLVVDPEAEVEELPNREVENRIGWCFRRDCEFFCLICLRRHLYLLVSYN